MKWPLIDQIFQEELTKEQLKELQDAFNLFDKNKDGKISTSELEEAMRRLGQNPTKDEVEKMIKEVDADKSGFIEFNEFVTMMKPMMHQESTEEELMAAFKAFDKNGDGFISKEELHKAMKEMGQELSLKEIEEMIKAADTNSDGQVDYKEFVKMMKAGQ